MKNSNKAPQSTEIVRTTTCSCKRGKSKRDRAVEVREVDKSPTTKSAVKKLSEVMEFRRVISSRYRIMPQSVELLIRIATNWEEGKPSSAYTLAARGDKGDLTGTYHKLSLLVSKGLIEVVGNGHCSCNLYAPTSLGAGEVAIMSVLCA